MSGRRGNRICARHGTVFLLALASLLNLAGCAGVSVGPKVIYERPAMFGLLMVTDDGNERRSLRFGNSGARQSTIKIGDPDHLEFEYAQLMAASLALVPAPRRLLVVGLGGGSLPLFLHRRYPQAVVEAVEIDPEVVKVAKAYFGVVEDARLKLHVGDGRAFIEQAPAATYDAILLDAFGSLEVPGHLTTLEFLEVARRALAPHGVVLSNVWNQRYNRLYDGMQRTHQEAFAELHLLVAGREVNRVFVGLAQLRGLTAARLTDAVRREAAVRPYRFDAADIVARSYLALPAKDAAMPVLRDGVGQSVIAPLRIPQRDKP